MANKIRNCVQARESMSDAASGALSSSRSADFDVHLRHCEACRGEFERMQTLLHAIDSGLSASVVAEPSPHLVASIRQAIAEEPTRVWQWWPRSAWLAAAGLCAALAICLFAIRTGRNAHETATRYATHPDNAPEANHAVVPVQVASSTNPRSVSLALRHSPSAHARRQQSGEPEIIVDRGQMRAILRLAAAVQSGRISDVELLVDQGPTAAPLEIEPLTISPLRILPSEDDAKPGVSNAAETGDSSFESGRLN